jgi:pimeloyl-ACP methyl ester carboxylesterase
MFIKSILKYSFLVLILSIILRIVLINQENKEDFKLQEEKFSKNVKNWFQKGDYFIYKNKYKIFYILSKITNENDNLNEVEINKPLKLDASIIVNVFLHGFPTSSYDYSKIWTQFSVSNQQQQLVSQSNRLKPVYLLTFDYLGYGFSDKPFNYTYSLFDNADLCDNLLLNFNILNINLIAHDIGDSVAQELLRRYNLKQLNFKINSLILTNGGIFYDIYKPVLSQMILRTEILNRIFVKYVFNKYLFQITFKNIFGRLYRSNIEVFDDLNDFFSIISYKYGQLNLPLTIKYLDEREQYNEVWLNALNETIVDSLMIFGPDDPINPDKEFSFKIVNDLPNVKFAKLNSVIGHYPQWEDSFTVFDIMYSFLFRQV